MMASADPRPVVLDACACINLAAAVPLGDVSGLIARPVVVVAQAAAEALFLHDVVDDEHVRQEIDLTGLDEVVLTPDELAVYVSLARRLDDGEAATLAIAHYRGWSIATDDRAARRAAQQLSPPADVLRSSVLLRACAASLGLDATAIGHMLRSVETRASFVPPQDDPNYGWWHASRAGP
jgi:predicted nucleic acid-binding protein